MSAAQKIKGWESREVTLSHRPGLRIVDVGEQTKKIIQCNLWLWKTGEDNSFEPEAFDDADKTWDTWIEWSPQQTAAFDSSEKKLFVHSKKRRDRLKKKKQSELSHLIQLKEPIIINKLTLPVASEIDTLHKTPQDDLMQIINENIVLENTIFKSCPRETKKEVLNNIKKSTRSIENQYLHFIEWLHKNGVKREDIQEVIEWFTFDLNGGFRNKSDTWE